MSPFEGETGRISNLASTAAFDRKTDLTAPLLNSALSISHRRAADSGPAQGLVDQFFKGAAGNARLGIFRCAATRYNPPDLLTLISSHFDPLAANVLTRAGMLFSPQARPGCNGRHWG